MDTRRSGSLHGLAAMSFHLVTKFHHAALVGFDLCEMQGNISVELLEEWDSITNQDRQDRIANFVGQPETKAFAGNCSTSDEPDAPKHGPQAPIHKLRKIPRVELDGIPDSRQIT